MKIYKWTLKHTGVQTIEMPSGAKVLTVQHQHGEAQIWALCNPSNPPFKRTFRIIGTGHDIPEEICPSLKYIGTYQVNGGDYVFHVFEQI